MHLCWSPLVFFVEPAEVEMGKRYKFFVLVALISFHKVGWSCSSSKECFSSSRTVSYEIFDKFYKIQFEMHFTPADHISLVEDGKELIG